MTNIEITILTCTYNRAYKLADLFTSLKKQDNKKFIWMIVDDGSKDNTKEIIDKWIEEDSGFLIKYYYKNNGGKHTAINYALEKINTQWTFIVDSDDYLTDDSIEYVYRWIDDIQPNIEKYMGIGGLRGYSEKEVLGTYPSKRRYKDHIDVNQLNRNKYGLKGDKSEIYRTDLLRKYPFPVFEGENFIPESSSIYKIAKDGYITRYYNKINYICHYLQDGLTNSPDLSKNNFQGFTYNEKIKYQACPFPENIMALVRFCDIAKKKGLSNEQIITAMECYKLQFWIAVVLMYIRRVIKACRRG